MSRRLVSSPNAEPEIRQRGMVYQKGRKQTDAWIPAERAYGCFRVDVPGEIKQKQVRVGLGICRDKTSAVIKLRKQMEEAGVLDVGKIRERISNHTTFRSQAIFWLSELRAGRIVSKKNRKPVRETTISGYSTAVAYLCEKVGDKFVASLDNPEARILVTEMKAEQCGSEPRFGDKTTCEYFKVFTSVIASATDNGNPLFVRNWNLAYIGLPLVDKMEQKRPTITKAELEALLGAVKRPLYSTALAMLAVTGVRISELLALEIGKHIAADCKVITVKQQRGLKGTLEPPKTKAGYRRVDLCSPLANVLKDFIGDRKSGFLFHTETGEMIAPGNLWRDGFATAAKGLGLDIKFHTFRRFRESVLQASDCRELLIKFWMGHTDTDMGSRYGKQLLEDVPFRQEWANKVGLGFDASALISSVPVIRVIRKGKVSIAA